MSKSKNVTNPGDCQETGKRLLLNVLSHQQIDLHRRIGQVCVCQRVS
jgi:hypothetical protein